MFYWPLGTSLNPVLGLYRVPADRKKRQELLKYFDSNYRNGGEYLNINFMILIVLLINGLPEKRPFA